MTCTTSFLPSAMKTSTYAPPSRASSVPSLRALLVACGLSALSGMSCSVRHAQTLTSQHLDSISERIEVLPTPVTLPEGAGFHARRGKTHLTLTRRGDSLEATATTDSLTVLPRLTQREQRHTAHSAKTSTTATTGFPFAPWQLATALTLIIILTLLLWPRRRM